MEQVAAFLETSTGPPSCQQICPIALLAADAENAADAVQARHMIELDESRREVDNMS